MRLTDLWQQNKIQGDPKSQFWLDLWPLHKVTCEMQKKIKTSIMLPEPFSLTLLLVEMDIFIIDIKKRKRKYIPISEH